MKKKFAIFIFLLFTINISILLYTPFATDSSLANGLTSAKVCWFYYAIFSLSINILISVIILRNTHFTLTPADYLLVTYGAIIALTYNWALNPEPEKLLFGAQLLALWFTLRYIFINYSLLKPFFLILLLCTGLGEVVIGIEQLNNWSNSNHAAFKLTGTFFNPGPYSGFLAVLLPISFDLILQSKPSNLIQDWRFHKVLYYFAWICLLATLIILPAGKSRSADLAALISCGWVYRLHRRQYGREKEKKERANQIIGFWFKKTALILILAGVGWTVYLMRKESADGRLIRWKITSSILPKYYLKGTGLGGFPTAYAQAQANYFSSADALIVEKRIVGYPSYAFNEYLQILIEHGIVGLLLFGSWIGVCLYYSYKSRQYGINGSLLALLVFATFSYPLHLPTFWILLILLTAYTPSSSNKKIKGKNLSIIIACISILSLGICWKQKDKKSIYRQWGNIRILYDNRVYGKAGIGYTELYEAFKHHPQFLFEGAQCFRQTHQYAKADQWLEKAIKVSSDPMLYYVKAINLQSLGKLEEAEKLLLYAIQILPERLYPYYLLTKLYADPAFHQINKMRETGLLLLTKKPKIQNLAVQQMQEEIQRILNQNLTTSDDK